MTKKVKSGDDIVGNSRIPRAKKSKILEFLEIASVALLACNDGILNKIASSFVSLTPRNDGIFAMTQGILEFLEQKEQN